MENFGKKLLQLRTRRGFKGNGPIARRALGQEATVIERRDFANYLARIERGEVRSPGLGQLSQIARGYELSLSKFFEELELQESSQTKSDLPSPPNDVQTQSLRSDRVAEGATDGGADLIVSAAGDDRALLVRLSRIFAAAATGVEAPRKQIGKTRPRKPKGSRRAGGDRR